MNIKDKYKNSEVGYIPNDWNIKLLKEISSITRLAGAEYSSVWEEDENGEIIALRGFNIGKNQIIEKDFVRISETLSLKLNRSKLYEGDVVYPCVGTIGNAVVIDVNDKYHIQQNIAKITPKKDVSPHYLAYYLMSPLGLNEIMRFNATSSQPNVLVGSLRDYRIVLPPTKEEQTAIATVLSDADELINSLEKLIAKKRLIKQGAMQELLTGKKRLPGFSGEWETKKMGRIAEMYSGGTPLTDNTKFYNGGIPWVVIADITKSGKYIHETEKTISDEGLRNSSARLFKKGVLLFAMYASIGKCTISTVNISCNQAILGIQPLTIDTEYLYYFLTFNEAKFSLMGQTGTQSNLNKEIVQNLDIPYPRLDEQAAIARVLGDMDSEIEALEQKLAKYNMIKQGMMQVLLTGKIRLVDVPNKN